MVRGSLECASIRHPALLPFQNLALNCKGTTRVWVAGRPYSERGQHELSNGLLLRNDLHTLFDQHYLTIEPNKKTLIISRRIREQFENGRDYYALKERLLAKPSDALALPSTDNLTYHFKRFTELEGT
jgi:hypothetical protein